MRASDREEREWRCDYHSDYSSMADGTSSVVIERLTLCRKNKVL